MIILIRLKSFISLLAAVAIFTLSGLGIYYYFLYSEISPVLKDETLNQILGEEINNIFKTRNQSLLQGDTDILGSLYNKEYRNGLWAYEHELNKMKYLYNWSVKQAVKFKTIDSEVIIRDIKTKGNGYSLNLLVSTQYEYTYEGTHNSINSFRIGTYHSLDIMPDAERYLITREWYTDPFADSFDLDEMKSQDIRQLILTGEPKDLSNLNERRIKAVDYAHQYCGAASLPEFGFKYNPKYRNFNAQGGDCANFASQMLYEGGTFKKSTAWNYKKGAGSKAWINAHAFNNYMTYSGRASVIAHGTYDKVIKDSYKLLPGDYVAYEKKGKITHISVVTDFDSNGYVLVDSHNADRYRVPWDLGWSNKGIKFWLVRVHY